MPLITINNCRNFYTKLYGGVGCLETITLLIRQDDQKEGQVRSAKVFNCRHSAIIKTGEPIQGDMTADHRVLWHIPQSELDRIGCQYINALHRIVDKLGRYWEPESTTPITMKLMEQHVCIQCLRVDPLIPGAL